MPVLAKVSKQPQEVESWAVVYDDDLNESEDIQSSYHSLVSSEVAGRMIKNVDYTVTADDEKHLIVMAGGRTLTIPSGLALTELYVAHGTQSDIVTLTSPDTIDGTNKLLSTHESVVIAFVDGQWTVVAEGDSILSITDEQRVRLFVSGGTDGETYKAEITTTTNEGRVLQDEIVIKVKES